MIASLLSRMKDSVNEALAPLDEANARVQADGFEPVDWLQWEMFLDAMASGDPNLEEDRERYFADLRPGDLRKLRDLCRHRRELRWLELALARGHWEDAVLFLLRIQERIPASILASALEQYEGAIRGGRKAARAKRQQSIASRGEELAREAALLVEAGTSKRNVASALARRHNCSPNTIRKALRRFEQKRSCSS